MNYTEQEIKNILAEYADGMVQGNMQVDDLMRKHQIAADSDIAALLLLAETLESVLVRVHPSSDFVEHLRQELLNNQDALDLLDPLRYIHLKTRQRQIAAGIGGLTVAAGVLWWVRRVGFELLRRGASSKSPEVILAS